MAGHEGKDADERWGAADSWRKLVLLDGRFYFNGEKCWDPLPHEGLLGRMATASTMRWERDDTVFTWCGARAALVGKVWPSMLLAQSRAPDGELAATVTAVSYRPKLRIMPAITSLRFPADAVLDEAGQLVRLNELYLQQQIALDHRQSSDGDPYHYEIGDVATQLQLRRELELGVQYFQQQQ